MCVAGGGAAVCGAGAVSAVLRLAPRRLRPAPRPRLVEGTPPSPPPRPAPRTQALTAVAGRAAAGGGVAQDRLSFAASHPVAAQVSPAPASPAAAAAAAAAASNGGA